jgi:nucleoid-associated protein YgaU
MIRSVRTAVLGALILVAPSLFAQTGLAIMPEPEIDKYLGDVMITEAPSFKLSDLLIADRVDEATLAALWFLDPGAPFESLSFEAIAAFAQATGPATDAAPASMTEAELKGLLNNVHFKESLRLKTLALEAFEYGDYDASANYAAESARAALRSDEYVAKQLKKKAAGDGIASARERLDWAASIGAEQRYAQAYSDASAAYEEAVATYSVEDYDASIAASGRVKALLADVSEFASLPARYTVRTWAENRDCFWNIAGYPFVYGDPTQWRRLYEANKSKLRRPDNPDLIHPGLVLDIPSIRGETRDGMWVKDRAYAPLPKRK